MKVLVACEESQRVTIEFRKVGHEAYSCDLLDCSGNHPEWHIKKDVTLLLNGNCIFSTVDGLEHEISGKWDMIIAFPPCTYLTVTGNRWFNYGKYGDKAIQRMIDRNDAIKFFMKIANADCDKIAIENPVGIMSTRWRKPDQIIQPYQFGDSYEKRTCLWLKGLQKLIPTKIVDIPDRIQFNSGKTMAKWYVEAGNLPKEQRALVRSKTFSGIAKAMAEQWGNCNTTNKTIIAKIEDINYCPNQNTCCVVSPYVHCDYNYKSDACIKAHKNFIHYCEQVHKQLKAKHKPEWYHVSLATLANIDFDMLDEKRQLYLSLYLEIKELIKDLHNCKSGRSYEKRLAKMHSRCADLVYENKVTLDFIRYVTRKVSMCNVECGLWTSATEESTGYHKSRRYNQLTIRY